MTRSILLDLGGVLETGCRPGSAQAWAPRLRITSALSVLGRCLVGGMVEARSPRDSAMAPRAISDLAAGLPPVIIWISAENSDPAAVGLSATACRNTGSASALP